MGISIEAQYKKAIKRQSDIEQSLKALPHGYISKKLIYGKAQYYLQRRIDRRIVSKYIPHSELVSVQKKLTQREKLISELTVLQKRCSELEAAAKLIDERLYSRLLLLRDCIPMEALTPLDREKAALFGNAMNAVEGVPATEEVQSAIGQWVTGNVSFLSIYEATLKKYRFPTEGN